MENISEDYKLTIMKELSIEEKANRYDEVLNKLRHFIAQGVDPLITRADVQDFFPELAESEDEKMRAMAIKAVYAPDAQSCIKSWGINPDDVIAWLEKQGEQKPTELIKEYDFHGLKFIPKFAKGDIIKDKKRGEVSTIKDFSYDTGLYTHTYGQFPITIQDNYEIIEQKPADKVDQHSLPVSDDSSLPTLDESIYHPCTEKAYEQKPTDKSKIKPKFKTGDRVIGVVSGILYFITEVCDDYYNTESGCIIMFYAQDNFKFCEKKLAEWSEEDRKLIDETCDLINTLASGYGEKATEPISFSGAQQISNIKTRLKALVDSRPQNRWKPTKRQLLELSCVISGCSFDTPVLVELEEDLKKLMEK